MPRVKLYANLRKVAETKEVVIPGESIAAVVIGLVRQKPALAPYLLADGQIRPHAVITVNGNPTSDAQAAIADQDEIAIFPPIAGG